MLAEALGGSAEVEITRGYPPLVNDPETVAQAREAIRHLFGEGAAVDP
jgi:metal-dependent amidase/aminoacylase/carboxypeptidase family protein